MKAICDQHPLSELIHHTATRLLSEYFAIGGLPEIVASWALNQEPFEIRDKLVTVVTAYQQDFEKYAKKSQRKYLNLLLDHVPRQLR